MMATGMTGQAIIKAILAGQRDPRELAAYRDHRVKAREAEIAAHLEGNWQEDRVFVLQQEQDGYEFCQRQRSECDHKMEQYLAQMEDRSQGADLPVETRKAGLRKTKQGKTPGFELRAGIISHDGQRSHPD